MSSAIFTYVIPLPIALTLFPFTVAIELSNDLKESCVNFSSGFIANKFKPVEIL